MPFDFALQGNHHPVAPLVIPEPSSPGKRFVFAVDFIETHGRKNAGNLPRIIKDEFERNRLPESVRVARARFSLIEDQRKFSRGNSAVGCQTNSDRNLSKAPEANLLSVRVCVNSGKWQIVFDPVINRCSEFACKYTEPCRSRFVLFAEKF